MDVDENLLHSDIGQRRFPGEEEPTNQAAWLSLATVLLVLGAVLVYCLHLAAPDVHQEYTDYMKTHRPNDARGHLEAARFCAALGAKLDSWREKHLREAHKLDPALPGLEDELLRRYREKAASVSSAPARVALAEWCVSFGLRQLALDQYRAAVATDPSYHPARKGLEDLEK